MEYFKTTVIIRKMEFASDFIVAPAGFPADRLTVIFESFKRSPATCILTPTNVICIRDQDMMPILYYGLLLLILFNTVGQCWRK